MAAAVGTESSGNDQKLLEQIEFYFGDANLPFDKFIKKESVQNDGWFPLVTLLKFNRVRALTDGLTSDEDREKKIVDVLRQSILIEVEESGTKIRRNLEMPLPEGNSELRSVYIKGFHKTETKLDQLIQHFKKEEGFEAVVMRYYKEKVLVCTPKEENNVNGAAAAVKAETSSTEAVVKVEDNKNNEISSTEAAVKIENVKNDETSSTEAAVKIENVKNDETSSTEAAIKVENDKNDGTASVEKDVKGDSIAKITPKVENGVTKTPSENSSISSGPSIVSSKLVPTDDKIAWVKKFKGSIFVVFKTVELAQKLLDKDDFTFPGNQVPYIRMMQKQYKDKKRQEFEERQNLKRKLQSVTEDTGKEQDQTKELPVVDHLTDVLVKVKTIPDGFTREILKEKWYAVAPEDKFSIAFVDFQRGDTSAVLRLEREGSAKEALELLSGKLTLGDDVLSVIEGFEPADEKAYNIKIQEERMKLKRKGGFGRGRGRGRGRGAKRGRY